jgi:hypothetical protein
MDERRGKFGWEKLSDVQVPRGMLWGILVGLWWRQRKTNQALDEFGERSSELGQLLGESRREGTEREERLVQLQASIERMTRWLVWVTVALGLLGVGSIALTVLVGLS